jgi:hypothetical protein
MYQNFISCSVWIIFHYMYVPYFAYLLICWETFRLLPPFGYCEKCCYEHWCVFEPLLQHLYEGYISGVAESYGNSVCIFLRNHQTIFYSNHHSFWC